MVNKSIEFYVRSDFFIRTAPYIGKSIKIYGETVNVYNSHVVYEKQVNPITVKYKIENPNIPSLGTYSTKTISPTSYETIKGQECARYVVSLGSVPIVQVSNATGWVTLEVEGFTTDPKYYEDDSVNTKELPIID